MRVIRLGAFCVSLLTPAAALADDVTVALPGATIPVGPAGTTVVNVSRSIVAGERFAVIRARAPEQLSRCGVAPERVAVWGLLEGAWTEMAHEVIDRCPTLPTRVGRRVQPQVVRARIVEIIERGLHRAEFHVRLVDPRLPSDQWPVARYHRDGDRFTVQRPTEVLAAAPGPSYTVETLERQRRLHGARRPLVLLLGADAFARLEAWHRWRELFELAHVAVATRPGHELRVGAGDTALDAEFAARKGSAADLGIAPAGRIVPFAITALEISATAIRRRLAAGLNARYLVPDAVLDYIDSHQIYRTPHGH